MECTMFSTEVIRTLCCFVPGEYAIFSPISASDVNALPLDQVTRKSNPGRFIVQSTKHEAWIEQPKKSIKRGLVAAMRSGSQQDHVAFSVRSQTPKELKPLLTSLVGAYASVSFVDNHKTWASTSEAVSALVRFNVVEADNREWVGVEQGLGCWEVAFKASCRASGDRHSVQIELGTQFACPLLHQVRWTQNGKPINLASINEFAQDQSGFDCLTDADVISDHESHSW
jgi:hypothetical protein